MSNSTERYIAVTAPRDQQQHPTSPLGWLSVSLARPLAFAGTAPTLRSLRASVLEEKKEIFSWSPDLLQAGAGISDTIRRHAAVAVAAM